eukprot:XP_016662509.1 PREDICTED: uncharacterized protein LOC100569609 [Acyrthosiphon pisum]
MAKNVKYQNISIQPTTVPRASKTVYELPRVNLTEDELTRKSTSDRTKRRVAHKAKFPPSVITESVTAKNPQPKQIKKLVLKKDRLPRVNLTEDELTRKSTSDRTKNRVGHKAMFPLPVITKPAVVEKHQRKPIEKLVLKKDRLPRENLVKDELTRKSTSDKTKNRVGHKAMFPLPVITKLAVVEKPQQKLIEKLVLKKEGLPRENLVKDELTRKSTSDKTKNRVGHKAMFPLPVITKLAVVEKPQQKLIEKLVLKKEGLPRENLVKDELTRKSTSDKTKNRVGHKAMFPLPVITKLAVVEKPQQKLIEKLVLKKEGLPRENLVKDELTRKSTSDKTKNRVGHKAMFPLPVITKPAVVEKHQRKPIEKLVLKKEGGIWRIKKPCNVLDSARPQHSQSSSSGVKGVDDRVMADKRKSGHLSFEEATKKKQKIGNENIKKIDPSAELKKLTNNKGVDDRVMADKRKSGHLSFEEATKKKQKIGNENIKKIDPSAELKKLTNNKGVDDRVMADKRKSGHLSFEEALKKKQNIGVDRVKADKRKSGHLSFEETIKKKQNIAEFRRKEAFEREVVNQNFRFSESYSRTEYQCQKPQGVSKETEFRRKVAFEREVVNPNFRFSESYSRTEYQCRKPQGVSEETCQQVSYAMETVMAVSHGKRNCRLTVDVETTCVRP